MFDDYNQIDAEGLKTHKYEKRTGGRTFNFPMLFAFIFMSVHSLAQVNTPVYLASPESETVFADIKKLQVKEKYNPAQVYEPVEFKPCNNDKAPTSFMYEFVVFQSEKESSEEIKKIEGGLLFLDKGEFKRLGISVVKGGTYSLFQKEFNIFISDKIARLYFGDEDPIDKILILENKYSVLVKGVFLSNKKNLSMEFDFIAGPVTLNIINNR